MNCRIELCVDNATCVASNSTLQGTARVGCKLTGRQTIYFSSCILLLLSLLFFFCGRGGSCSRSLLYFFLSSSRKKKQLRNGRDKGGGNFGNFKCTFSVAKHSPYHSPTWLPSRFMTSAITLMHSIKLSSGIVGRYEFCNVPERKRVCNYK